MKPHHLGLAFLGLATAGVLGAWALWPRPSDAHGSAATVEDDLEMLAAVLEAGAARDSTHDLLVASAGADLYLARASDRTLVAISKSDGTTRELAHLDAPATALALGGGALWIASGHTVSKLPLSDAGAPAVVAQALAGPRALASDGTWTFVVDVDTSKPGMLHDSAIVRVSAAGGGATVVGRAKGDVANVTLDDANAYWADPLEGTIMAVPKAGGAPHAVAIERGLPGQVLAVDGALYWVERRSESLWTLPAAGGQPRSLVQDFAGFADFVVDARDVAWRSEAAVDGAFRVVMVPKAGGEATTASAAVSGIDALATDGAHLYWARDGAVSRVDAPSD